MGKDRKFARKGRTRKKKTGTERRRRIKVHRARLVARGMKVEDVNHMTSQALRDNLMPYALTGHVQAMLARHVHRRPAKAGIDVASETARTPRVGELPFDSDRKLMSTVHRVGTGFDVYVKGSPQELLGRCTHEDLGGRVVEMTDTGTFVHATTVPLQDPEGVAVNPSNILGFKCSSRRT